VSARRIIAAGDGDANLLVLGEHFPTDVLVGAMIGVVLVVWFNTERMRNLLARPALFLMDKRPALFYAGFFLLTYQISDLFNAARSAAKALLEAF
jgi:hypothetical protein